MCFPPLPLRHNCTIVEILNAVSCQLRSCTMCCTIVSAFTFSCIRTAKANTRNAREDHFFSFYSPLLLSKCLAAPLVVIAINHRKRNFQARKEWMFFFWLNCTLTEVVTPQSEGLNSSIWWELFLFDWHDLSRKCSSLVPTTMVLSDVHWGNSIWMLSPSQVMFMRAFEENKLLKIIGKSMKID